MITYTESADGITTESLAGFFVGWPKPPSPEIHLKILQQSAHIVLAMDESDNRVVGFINAVSDGVLSAYIPLLEVLPEYKHRGIGSELVRRLLDRLDNLYMIDLTCDPELQPFYQRFGLVPYSGMMRRNFDRQSGA